MRPTRLQQDLIQGFRQGFSNQYKSWMDLNHVFEMSPMVGQQGLKSFLAEMFSKDALSKSDAIILKTILFENSGNEPRWKQSFYVQFVIGRLLKSERKSSSQYGQKLLQKIRSFTAILSETEKHQFYSELSHYFKKARGVQALCHDDSGMVQHHIQHVPIKRDGKGWSKLVLRMMNSCCPIYLRQWWITQNRKTL